MKIIDISLLLHTDTIAYPKNPAVRIKSRSTGHSTISEIAFGSHTGTHVDAQRHVFKNGAGVDRIPLERCIGPCRVLDMTKVKKAITVQDLRNEKIKAGERILVKTSNSKRGYKKFYSDYVHLDGDAAQFLAKKKIALFGTDYLSVKQRGSPDNRPHTELLKHSIPIVEGLDLSKVKPGKYDLVVLPLRFIDIDGAPARAILLS